MKKLSIILSFLVLFNFSGKAQTYQKTDLGLKAKIKTTEVEIQFFDNSTVRVIKSPEGRTFTKESLSVTKIPQTVKFALIRQEDIVSLKSDL